MARDEQHLFDFRRLHISFAALSALVLVSLIAFVRADNDREWKKWQRGFYDLSHRAAIERLAELRAVNEAGEEDSIEGFRRQRDLAVIDGRRRALELDIENSRSRREILRQRLEIGGYEATEELHALDAMVLELTRDLERLDSRRRDFLPPRQEAGRDAVDAEILRLKRQATETRPSRLSFMREAPILDVFTGRLRIRSISVKDFPVPNRFARVPREDRCITCHMGIDTPGYEAEPNPYKTHPRLDLFVSDGSPHPSSAFGCTFCHGGGGDSLTFVGSGHMPGSEEQAEAWRTLYRWTAPGGTQQAMTQAAFAESACNICHIEDVRLDYAPRLTRGRAIFERAGCIGCHPVSGLSPPWKPGSDLRLVASKVSEPWIRKWIASPRAFRKNTSMPEIFPDGGPQIRRRQEAEIASIAAYLTATSPKIPSPPRRLNGKRPRGSASFQEHRMHRMPHSRHLA